MQSQNYSIFNEILAMTNAMTIDFLSEFLSFTVSVNTHITRSHGV